MTNEFNEFELNVMSHVAQSNLCHVGLECHTLEVGVGHRGWPTKLSFMAGSGLPHCSDLNPECRES